jgi:protein TonB
MVYGHTRDSARSSLGFGVVVLLHIALVYGLVNLFAHATIAKVPRVTEGGVFHEAPKKQQPPVVWEKPKVAGVAFVPHEPDPGSIPVINIVDAAQPNIDDLPVIPSDPPSQPVHTDVPRTAALVKKESCQAPAYPSSAIRLGQSGKVTLNFLVGTDGRVLDGKVQNSSGFAILDRAALQALSLCRFQPGTLDGRPTQSWASMSYNWTLEQ